MANEVLSRYEEVGLINDSAFADAWVESRHHGRGLARRALVQELRTKGVDPTLIDEAVGQLDSEQEEATARELVARKLRATRGLDRDKRLRRLAGMLARKGYPEGMALRVVRRALEEEGEDTEGLGDEGSDPAGRVGASPALTSTYDLRNRTYDVKNRTWRVKNSTCDVRNSHHSRGELLVGKNSSYGRRATD